MPEELQAHGMMSQPKSGDSHAPGLPDLISKNMLPAQESILSALDIADIIALKRTSKAFVDIDATLAITDFNINKKLQKFVRNPTEFRNLQAKYNFLIGGNFAINFFARNNAMPPKMCIHTEEEHLPTLETYLLNEGYKSDVSAGWTLEFKRLGIEIEVDCLRDSPALYSLLDGREDTASVSFLSWNKAFALFGHSTYVAKEIYPLFQLQESMAQHYRYLANAGYTMKKVHWKQAGCGGDCEIVTRPRRVGDRHTWVINLDTKNITPSEMPNAVIESSTFIVRCVWNPHLPVFGKISHYDMSIECKLRHPVLEYQYVTGKWPKEYEDKIQQICDRMNEQTLIAMLIMREDDRPDEFQALMNGDIDSAELRGTFDLPQKWVFYDKEVIQLLNDLLEDEEPRKSPDKELSSVADRGIWPINY
ncbi:hypothetical protein BDV96DRAFT_642579 [Lophiotrema nucula]|uniref:Uncharacterized protein n=1 Tax=Lophiotrema nucula TaxID=690887 RepID=A0A6A5ZMW7_9PLEO|nr:hypothetical protein BDV96DRAFT_642579 [Lophiotrema nucula]